MLWKPLSAAVWSLQNLQTLNLEGFALKTSLLRITSLTSLTTLRLTSCYLTTSSLYYLTPMTSLRTLELPQNPECGVDISPLSSLHQLTRLDLTGTQLADTGVAKILCTGSFLNHLQHLNISQTFVSAASLAPLAKLQQLTALVMEKMSLMGTSEVPPLQTLASQQHEQQQQQGQQLEGALHEPAWGAPQQYLQYQNEAQPGTSGEYEEPQEQPQQFPKLQHLSMTGFANLGHSWLPFRLTSLTSLHIHSIKGNCIISFLTSIPTAAAVEGSSTATAVVMGPRASGEGSRLGSMSRASSSAAADRSLSPAAVAAFNSQLQSQPQPRLQHLSISCSSAEAATAVTPDVAAAYASIASLHHLTYLSFTTHVHPDAYSHLFRIPGNMSTLRVLHMTQQTGSWAQDTPIPPAAVPLLVSCCPGLRELRFRSQRTHPASLTHLSGLAELSRLEVECSSSLGLEEQVVLELVEAVAGLQQLRGLVIDGCGANGGSSFGDRQGGSGSGGSSSGSSAGRNVRGTDSGVGSSSSSGSTASATDSGVGDSGGSSGSSGRGGSRSGGGSSSDKIASGTASDVGGGANHRSSGSGGSNGLRASGGLCTPVLAALARLCQLDELRLDDLLRLRSGKVSWVAMRWLLGMLGPVKRKRKAQERNSHQANKPTCV